MAEKKTIYFYHQNKKHGHMSQWHNSGFVDNEDNVFWNCEQYMMYQKAKLFKDDNIARQIMQNSTPKKVKELGRKVRGFSDKVWKEHRFSIVYQGNYLKYSNNKSLKKQLLDTGDAELVEASPYDRIWGIGFREDNAYQNRDKWGLNLLGKALMKVRETLKNE